MRRGPDPPRLKPCSLFAAVQVRSCCSASRRAGRHSRLTAAPTTAAAAALSATRRTAQAAQRQQRKGIRQRRQRGMRSMRPARCPCSRPAALPGSTWWRRWALSMYAAVQWLPPLSCVCCPTWIHLTDNAGRRCLMCVPLLRAPWGNPAFCPPAAGLPSARLQLGLPSARLQIACYLLRSFCRSFHPPPAAVLPRADPAPVLVQEPPNDDGGSGQGECTCFSMSPFCCCCLGSGGVGQGVCISAWLLLATPTAVLWSYACLSALKQAAQTAPQTKGGKFASLGCLVCLVDMMSTSCPLCLGVFLCRSTTGPRRWACSRRTSAW